MQMTRKVTKDHSCLFLTTEDKQVIFITLVKGYLC